MPDPDLIHPSSVPPGELPIIGWREWVVLPELGVPGIKAKIDSGARSSALHTSGFEIIESEGQTRVKFTLHPLARKDLPSLDCESPVHDQRLVRDSGGHEEFRPFIWTTVKLGEHEWPVEFSLTNREGMLFRMLLGRTAMARRFAIDPARSYLGGPKLWKLYRKPNIKKPSAATPSPSQP